MDYFDKFVFSIKTTICITPMVGGIYSAIDNFIYHNYWGALSALLLGIGLCYGIIVSFAWGKIRMNLSSTFFSVCAFLGLIGILSSHKALDSRYQQIRHDLSLAFMNSVYSCNGKDEIMLKGTKDCTTGVVLDITDLSYQLSKAIHLDPISSLIDGVYSASEDEKIDKCLIDYVAARKQCPAAFIMLEKKFPELIETKHTELK
ncbi:hypothetical protein [Dickeya oryzae]|uniref:DUF4760 domain-containing protein n=1 Tax=Dickeya oryzae TaxID=1240404 RepID=A0AB39IN82_9GAMM|nr:hypothetical protein [Dickeya oryzae]MCA6997080.1 hypothetical protein [Dickeya oryzae]